jgi:hypothetical protein
VTSQNHRPFLVFKIARRRDLRALGTIRSPHTVHGQTPANTTQITDPISINTDPDDLRIADNLQ